MFLPHKERGSKTGSVHSVRMRKEDLRCPEPPLGPFEEACMGSTLYDEANILNSLPPCFCFTQSQASLVFRKPVCSLYLLNVGLATHISANSLGRSWGSDSSGGLQVRGKFLEERAKKERKQGQPSPTEVHSVAGAQHFTACDALLSTNSRQHHTHLVRPRRSG